MAAQIPVSDAPTSTIRTYSDVASTDWFYDGVKYVSDREIMTGMDEASSPPKQHHESQLVTMLYRLAGSPDLPEEGLDYPFSDVDASSWYGPAVYWPGPTASSPAPVTPPSPPTAR